MEIPRKTCATRSWQVSGVALTVILLLLMAVSCDRRPKQPEEGPPAPEAPVSNLELPDPVAPGDMEGEASLPDTISLGFAMDLDGRLMGGDWNVEGTVTEVTPGKVSLVSNQQKEGHLVYRLPAGLRFLVSPGQAISIRRNAHLFRSAMGYDLVVESSGELTVAAGLLQGSTPREVRLRPGLSLRQIGQRESRFRETRYETTYTIPVVLTVGGVDRSLLAGKPADFFFRHKEYSVLILESSETVPKEDYEGIFDGGGYVLKYVVVSTESD